MGTRSGSRLGRLAAAGGVLSLFALAVAVFVLPGEVPAAGVEAAGFGDLDTPAPARPVPASTTRFPGLATLPLVVLDPGELTTSVSFRMRRGEPQNQVRLEFIVPRPSAVVLASAAGTVLDTHASWNGRGTLVLRTENGYRVTYRNLGLVWVREGQAVREGQQIGVAASAKDEGASVLQYQVDAGSHYFGLLRMTAPDARGSGAWSLQVSPRGSTVVRDN